MREQWRHVELPKAQEYSQCGEYSTERATQVERGENEEGMTVCAAKAADEGEQSKEFENISNNEERDEGRS